MAHLSLPPSTGSGQRALAGLIMQLRAGYYFGELSTGDRLPSVRELAKQLRVSPTTALDLYKQLEDQGFVEGRERSGTFLRGVGLEAAHGARERALFNALACTASKLEPLGMPADEFSRLLAWYTGACPRTDFAFGVLSHLESFEMLDRQLQRRLKFRMPLVPLSPDTPRECEIRAQLGRTRFIRCLLSTLLFASHAFDLAREYQIPMIVIRLDATAARIFHAPETGTRHIILRDRDCAEDFRSVARATAGGQEPPILVASLDDDERLATIDREAADVYASSLCEEQVRARYGRCKRIRPLPSDLSQETVEEILFHYVFAH